MSKIFDYIIIGTGIAGLYSAYQIKKHNKSATLLLLEKNRKSDIGGRIGMDHFYGVEIAKGAGIGRIKDELLIKLLREFRIPIHSFISNIEYSPYFYEESKTNPKSKIVKTIQILRKEFRKEKNEEFKKQSQQKQQKNETFREFAIRLLGKSEYDDFIMKLGYYDFENTDIEEALYHYGFEDVICCNEIIHINWTKLIKNLVEKIGIENFRFSQNVKSIHKNSTGDFHEIKSESELESNSKIYFGKKVIIATTIQSLRTFFPNNPIYREIEGQNYLRIYGKFSSTSLIILKQVVKSYTVIPSILQKIIPIDPEKGVYMIAYNDNRNAYSLRKYLDNNEKNRDYYARELEKSLNLPRHSLHLLGIRAYYWEIGTHYYKPIDKTKYKTRRQFIKDAQNPEENVFVVGEVVSRKQGWTEGALESVDILDI